MYFLSKLRVHEIDKKVFEEDEKVGELDITRVFDKDKWLHFGRKSITLCNDFVHFSFDYKELFDIICKKKTGCLSKPKPKKIEKLDRKVPNGSYNYTRVVLLDRALDKIDQLIEVVNRL
jgi:hypothetical protein